MKPIVTSLATGLCCVVALAGTPSKIAVTLDVAPATTLPGIPVAIRMRVVNNDSAPYTPSDHVVLVARRDGGAAFIVTWSGNRVQAPLGCFRDTVIGPHASALLSSSVSGSAVEGGWFDDPRLNQPGHYELHVVIGSFVGDIVGLPLHGIESNRAVLQVNEPSGVDARIWRQMLALGDGHWVPALILGSQGRTLAHDVVSEEPTSTYAGWFATAGISPDFAVSADALRTWLAQASADEYTEWRQLRLAALEEAAARYYGTIRPDDTVRHARAAQTILQRLRSAKNTEIAAKAAARLEALGRPEQLAQ